LQQGHGSLWFATVRGAVVVDPRRRGIEPPRVAIESAAVDRQVVPIDRAVRIAPDQENLEIQYTGLSWNRPHEIRFRYRLEGLDREWVDAGTRRTAYYSHLPPGTYRFVVTADNGEGVWNPVGQRLSLIVLPPFYRTWWFQSLVVVAGALLIAAAWRLRVSQLTRAQAMQHEFTRDLIASQERERQRIAGELHDGLGQRLVVIRNLALMSLEETEAAKGSAGRVGAIADQSSGAIEEIRDIAHNLRPYHLDTLGLTRALEVLVKTTASTSPIGFSHEIDDVDTGFPSERALNFYRIVQESLNNIVKHSSAKAASVTVRCLSRSVQLKIRDDGAGFSPDAVTRDGRRGGFGLVGINERALLLGGKAAVHSAPGLGTTITVEVPSL
jgi:signal transduction histidine kinase